MEFESNQLTYYSMYGDNIHKKRKKQWKFRTKILDDIQEVRIGIEIKGKSICLKREDGREV